MKVHLDTDLGGDPDDACALAMLLGWPGIDIVGITTTIDRDGLRAAYVRHCLGLVAREDIPVAAGAQVSMTTGKVADPFPPDDRYWPSSLSPHPSEPQDALDLLASSIAAGATVIGIGPFTNFALLERARPGSLDHAAVVIMGGWTQAPGNGFPQWEPDMDFNVQWDTEAAEVLAAHADLTLGTLPATMKAHLQGQDLPRLRASGPLGELLARQSQAFARDQGRADLGLGYPELPDDLLNFHWDPATCAVAVGWSGAVIRQMRVKTFMEGDVLRFQPNEDGRPARVVVDVDGQSFSEAWIAAAETAQRSEAERE